MRASQHVIAAGVCAAGLAAALAVPAWAGAPPPTTAPATATAPAPSAVAATTASATPPPAASAAPAPAAAPSGVAVVATGGATDAAWPLAQGVYGSASLRPRALDDAHARVLAGEAPPAGAPADLLDLAELRAGVKGDDAASRELLGAMAGKLDVRALLVVSAAGDSASARLFFADTRTFDAARYEPDASQPGAPLAWKGAVGSLERALAPQPVVGAPATRTRIPLRVESAAAPEKKETSTHSGAFYKSPWFWAAVGVAALAAGGVLLATQVGSSDTIHLQMQGPP